MFDIGFTELLLLAIIAMVVVGPERLPGLLRSVGKIVGQARRFMANLQNQIEQEVKISELNELNKKILAEEQELKKSLDVSHESQDAEVPSIAPNTPPEAPDAATVESAVNEQDDPQRS